MWVTSPVKTFLTLLIPGELTPLSSVYPLHPIYVPVLEPIILFYPLGPHLPHSSPLSSSKHLQDSDNLTHFCNPIA